MLRVAAQGGSGTAGAAEKHKRDNADEASDSLFLSADVEAEVMALVGRSALQLQHFSVFTQDVAVALQKRDPPCVLSNALATVGARRLRVEPLQLSPQKHCRRVDRVLEASPSVLVRASPNCPSFDVFCSADFPSRPS